MEVRQRTPAPPAGRAVGPVWWGLLLLALVLLAVRVASTPHLLLDDLAVYRLGGRAVLDHDALYSASSGRLVFTYPPSAALAFVPLALLPAGAAGAAMVLASVAAGGWAAAIVLGIERLRWLSTLPLLVALAASEPIARTLILGQVNLVLILMVLLDALVVPRRWRGVLVGLAAAIKLTPLVFVLWFLIRRDWRSAARSFATFLLATAAAALVLPTDSATYWSGAVATLGRFGDDDLVGVHNQSLYAVLLRALGVTDAGAVARVCCAVAGLALGLWAAKGWQQLGRRGEALVAVALGGLLAVPVSWTHHWVWLAVLSLILAARGRPGPAWALAVWIWLAPMWFVSVRAADVGGLTPGAILVSAAYTAVAIGWLALGRLDRMRRPGRDAVTDPPARSAVA